MRIAALALAVCFVASCGVDEPTRASFVVWSGHSVDPDTAVPRDSDRRPLSYRMLGQRAPYLGTADRVLGARWVLIDFWGVWCPDCLADAPYIAALATAIEAHPDIDFMSVHTPPSRARAAESLGRWGSVARYMAEKGYTYPVMVDTDASVRDAYRIDWTPTYLLVGPDRIIRAFRTDLGDTPIPKLIADIESVIAHH